MNLNFCFIGAGNLATHLSKAFQNKGFGISQVYSRTELSAKKLADVLSVNYVTSASEIDKTADIYIVALKDSAFDEVLSQINFNNRFVVHCSGSLPLSALFTRYKHFQKTKM
jgi:pyrroline-5-carboxylate reductase